MADDRAQFEKAMATWDRLHNAGSYSVPRDIGVTAIVCAYGTDVYAGNPEKVKKWVRDDTRTFRNEALAITDRLNALGRETLTIFDADSGDMTSVLQDPHVSDIHIIGHGNLSSMYIAYGDEGNTYDWQDAQLDADHLKTGLIIQRFCGLARRNLPVPFGSFIAADHRNVIAPVGKVFTPRGLQHPQVWQLQQSSPTRRLTYDYLSSIRQPDEE